jgi:hypothetical protein
VVHRQEFYKTFDNGIDSHEELKEDHLRTDWLESPARISVNTARNKVNISQKPQPQIDSRTGKTVFFF